MPSALTRPRRGAAKLSLLVASAVLALLVAFTAIRGGVPAEAQVPDYPDECVIASAADWKICIAKVTDPPGAAAEFDFEYQFSNSSANDFSLQAGETNLLLSATTSGITLTVTEVNIPSGWALAEIECFHYGGIDVSYEFFPETNSVVLDLPSPGGATMACFVRNEQVDDDDRDRDLRLPPNISGGLQFSAPPAPFAPAPTAALETAAPITPPDTGDAGLK